jgi:hypothetical protein
MDGSAHPAVLLIGEQYAFAQFHFVDLTAYHKDQEVWHVKLIPDIQAVPIGSAKFQENTSANYRVK